MNANSNCPLCDADATFDECNAGNIFLYNCGTCSDFFISRGAINHINKHEKHRKGMLSKNATSCKGRENILAITLKDGIIQQEAVSRAEYRGQPLTQDIRAGEMTRRGLIIITVVLVYVFIPLRMALLFSCRRSQSCFNVHMSVQNTDDLDNIGKRLTVKNHMTARVQFSISKTNITAIFSFERVGSQLLK